MTAGELTEETLQRQPWYHRKITRVASEALLKENGDFLVRDSISSPGEYVLTAFWKKPLHFQINATHERNSQKLYHFEEEDFCTVVDLISFYRTHRKAVTLASGCQINRPILFSGASGEATSAQEHEAQYARIFRPGGPVHETSHSLNRQAMMNWASHSSLSNSTQALNRSSNTLSSVNSRPMALGLGQSNTLQYPGRPLPFSLLRVPLPVPKKSPPRMTTENDKDDDYDDIDYDSMEPLTPIAPARSMLDGRMMRDQENSFALTYSSLRGAQSCEHLLLCAPRTSSFVSQHSGITIDSQREEAPKSSSPSPPFSSSTSTDSGNGTSDRESKRSVDNLSNEDDRGSQREHTDSACEVEEADLEYDLPRGWSTESGLSGSSLSSGLLKLTSPSTAERVNEEGNKAEEEGDYGVPRNTPIPAINSSFRERSNSVEPPLLPPKPILRPPGSISKASVTRFQTWFVDKKPSEIAVLIGYEDCVTASVLTSNFNTSEANCIRGVGSLLISSGAGRRQRLRTRCRLVQLSVLVTVLSGRSLPEAAGILSRWIEVADQTLNSHGNQYGFANLMRAITSEILDKPSLWQQVTPFFKESMARLSRAYRVITGTESEWQETTTTSLPLMQPLLEIFETTPATASHEFFSSSFIDKSSPANELDSLFRWLDAARRWSAMSWEMNLRCEERLGKHRVSIILGQEGENLFSDSDLSALLFGSSSGGTVTGPVLTYLQSRKIYLFE